MGPDAIIYLLTIKKKNWPNHFNVGQVFKIYFGKQMFEKNQDLVPQTSIQKYIHSQEKILLKLGIGVYNQGSDTLPGPEYYSQGMPKPQS